MERHERDKAVYQEGMQNHRIFGSCVDSKKRLNPPPSPPRYDPSRARGTHGAFFLSFTRSEGGFIVAIIQMSEAPFHQASDGGRQGEPLMSDDRDQLSPDAQRLNETIDGQQMLIRMGYNPDSIFVDGDLIRIFCPIHKDQVRRSLVLNNREKTFRCQYTQCPVHEGGPLIVLYAKCMNLDVADAVERLQSGEQKSGEASLLDRAQALIEELKYEEALGYLLKARKECPENTITRCKIASLYLEMGKQKDGYREYMAAAEDFSVKGELDHTLSIYNMLAMMTPESARLRRQMAYLFARLGRPMDAAEHLKWIIDFHMREKQTDAAVAICGELIEMLPEDPALRVIVMKLYAETGRHDPAVREGVIACEAFLKTGALAEAQDAIEWCIEHYPHAEELMELRYRINMMQADQSAQPREATPPKAGSDSDANEDDFNDFISSLEDSID